MKNKSLIVVFSLFAVVVLGLVVGIVVLASSSQKINSNITINYTASQIAGRVSATYKIGDGVEQNMVVNGNTSETVARFTANDNLMSQSLSPTESNISIVFGQDVILTYTFINDGGKSYYAKVSYTDTNSDDSNIKFYYKGADDSDFSTSKPPYVLVLAGSSTTFQIKITIANGAFDSYMSGAFNWDLTIEEPESFGENIQLVFANNTGSSVDSSSVSVEYSEDYSTFKLVGPTPLLVDGAISNVSALTNSSNAEFYYFCTNSQVQSTTDYVDPGKIYYVSSTTSDSATSTMGEIWYNTPTKLTSIYSTFMTPNNTTGTSTGSETGNIIVSHRATSIQLAYNDAEPDPQSGGLTGGNANVTGIVIPNSIKNLQANSIMGFTGDNFTRLDIPGSVVNMGAMAIMSSYFKNVYFPATLNTTYDLERLEVVSVMTAVQKLEHIYMNGIGGNVYVEGDCLIERTNKIVIAGCKNSIIPSDARYLADYLFYASDIERISIPDGINLISMGIAYCMKLKEINFSGSINFVIGERGYNFLFCGIETISCDSDNAYYYASGNCLIDKSTKTLILGFDSSTIPADGSVTSIGSAAFSMCSSLTSITIPSSVTSIGDNAFAGCSSLISITIENGVTSIGGSAFLECSGLTSITIPDSVTSIGDDAFRECGSLTSITIGSGVTSIGSAAFSMCSSLTSITIPDSITSIGSSAFASCDSLNYNTLNNVKYLGNSNNPYVLVMGVTDKKLTSYTISNNAKMIFYQAFSSCLSLTSITIPDGVTSIGSDAFFNCAKLTSITIPSSVTSIERYAFSSCTNLTSATFNTTSGWIVSTSSDFSSSTSLSSTDLANTSTAATYLRQSSSNSPSGYDNYYWKRS